MSDTTSDEAAAAGLDGLVDFAVLGRWMDEQGLPAGEITGIERLAGGTQNVLVRFQRGGGDYVLRRPPKHLRKASNEVLRRESKVLAALAGSDVPHPGLIAAETDADVMGVVFYLMEPVDGFNPSVGLPEAYTSDSSWLHDLGLGIVDGIAALGAVDHEAVGLLDLGKPEGFLERQVPRWLGELETYSELDGYPGPEIPRLDDVAAWLDDNRPSSWTPGILHGDYHLANVMLCYDRPALAAIVDWEMCTIGDPLLDLGWLLSMWPGDDGAAGPGVGGSPYAADFAKPAELVARYAERSTRDLSAIDWYTVLACFKLGIVLEGTHARACAGKADKGVGDLLHATTLSLFAKAATLI